MSLTATSCWSRMVCNFNLKGHQYETEIISLGGKSRAQNLFRLYEKRIQLYHVLHSYCDSRVDLDITGIFYIRNNLIISKDDTVETYWFLLPWTGVCLYTDSWKERVKQKYLSFASFGPQKIERSVLLWGWEKEWPESQKWQKSWEVPCPGTDHTLPTQRSWLG